MKTLDHGPVEEFQLMCPYCLSTQDNGHTDDCERPKAATKPKPAPRYWRVAWTEQYQKVFEATDRNSAIEDRDDKDAFVECSAIEAWEVRKCGKRADGSDCFGCDHCEGGYVGI